MSACEDKHLSDKDYTLVQTASQLGGVIRRQVDLITGEIATVSAEVSCEQDTARGGVLSIQDYIVSMGYDAIPLSKSHIRPQDETLREKKIKLPYLMWREGASFLKASKGSDGEKRGGGKKKKICGYSENSRRGLLAFIAGIIRDHETPCFLTLTYHLLFPDPKASKRHLKMFIQRLLRAFPDCSGIWKLEPQDRGAPHYHLLVWGVSELELKKFVAYAWHEIARDSEDDKYHLLFHLGLLENSKPCVTKVISFRGVWFYAAKYIGKTFSVAGWDDKHTGRFWGYINKEKLPLGKLNECEYSLKFVHHVMRYQRRFSGRRLRSSGFTLFCNADHWVKNLNWEVHQEKIQNEKPVSCAKGLKPKHTKQAATL